LKRRYHSPAYRKAIDPDNVHWQQLRWARYRLQGGRCAVCHLPLGFNWGLHHLHYKNLGRETVNDVRCVHAGICHKLADSWRRAKRKWR